jgi:hypothetical protein
VDCFKRDKLDGPWGNGVPPAITIASFPGPLQPYNPSQCASNSVMLTKIIDEWVLSISASRERDRTYDSRTPALQLQGGACVTTAFTVPPERLPMNGPSYQTQSYDQPGGYQPQPPNYPEPPYNNAPPGWVDPNAPRGWLSPVPNWPLPSSTQAWPNNPYTPASYSPLASSTYLPWSSTASPRWSFSSSPPRSSSPAQPSWNNSPLPSGARSWGGSGPNTVTSTIIYSTYIPRTSTETVIYTTL